MELEQDDNGSEECEVASHDADNRDVSADLCADSSDDDAVAAPDARARARGHGGGFMSSVQSKWNRVWGKTAAEADLPEEWQDLCDAQGRQDASGELVGDACDMGDEDEEPRVWGLHDQHRVGNEYTPGDPTGRERPPPKIIDRGSITGDEPAAGQAGKKGRDKLTSFFNAVAGGLGPKEEEDEEAEELTRAPRELQSTQELEEAVKQNLDKVQQWYRQLQQDKLVEMQTLVLAGKPQEALDTLRESNPMQPGPPRCLNQIPTPDP